MSERYPSAMHIELTGKRALVTGSTEGIGFGIAVGLARAGAEVVVNGRSAEKTQKAAQRVREAVPGAKVLLAVGDVGTVDGCEAIVKAAPDVDVLVNNAGIFEPTDFFDTSDASWDRHWNVNVMSGVRLSRAYLPGMERRKWGRVLFISSESAFNVPVEMIHYGVSKTADVAVARGLAKRMAGTGVTVNSVLPGPTLSEGVAAMLKDAGKPVEEAAADFVQAHRPSNLLRRATSVEEVANLVVYLASPLASATTGAAMRCDGGTWDSL